MPSVSIIHPMTGATVEKGFTVCGMVTFGQFEIPKKPVSEREREVAKRVLNWIETVSTVRLDVTDGNGTPTTYANIPIGADRFWESDPLPLEPERSPYIINAVLVIGTVDSASDRVELITVVNVGGMKVTIDGPPCRQEADKTVSGWYDNTGNAEYVAVSTYPIVHSVIHAPIPSTLTYLNPNSETDHWILLDGTGHWEDATLTIPAGYILRAWLYTGDFGDPLGTATSGVARVL